jgi:streptogramin lyase
MSELRERLDRELATVIPSVGARAEVERRLDQRTRRRRVAVPATALLVTAAIVGGLTYAFRSVEPTGPADSTSIALPGAAFQAIVHGDALWALTTEPGCDGPACRGFVVKVDTERGEVAAQIPVTSPTGLTAGAGSIWLASFADAMLIRIDPETADVDATIPLVLPGEEPGSDWKFLPTHVDANEDGVWVSTARGAVAHIDPATNTVVDVVPLPPESLGGVVIGRDGVWLDNGLGSVIQVDPETHEVEHQGSIDDEAGRRLSVGTPIARGGSLWLVGNWARPVEEFGEDFYEATDRQALVSIEESTGEVTMIVDLPKQPCCAWLLDDGDVWLVEGDGALIRRLDTHTGDLAEPIPVPIGRPLVVSGTTAWSAFGDSIRSWELPDGTGPTATPSPTVTAEPKRGTGPIRGAFYPPTYREGARIVMPVSFVDGTTAEVVFRGDLGADELGTYGEIGGGLGEVDRSIYFRYGTGSQFTGSGPLAAYEGHAGSTVEEWTPPSDAFGGLLDAECPILVFRFGDWFVGVRTCLDELSSEEKAQWARLLVGRQTEDGFLVLDAEPPLTIDEAGEREGPALWLQGSDRGSPFITLRPGPCTLDEPARNQELRVMPDGQEVLIGPIAGQVETWSANWCEGGMYVGVDSRDRDYVEAAAEGLRIQNITLAS